MQEPGHVYKRSFVSKAGETIVQYNLLTKSGTIQWAGDAPQHASESLAVQPESILQV